MPFENFVWSSRRETCDELCHFLLTTQPETRAKTDHEEFLLTNWDRLTAASLLSDLAEHEHCEQLQQIANAELERRDIKKSVLSTTRKILNNVSAGHDEARRNSLRLASKKSTKQNNEQLDGATEEQCRQAVKRIDSINNNIENRRAELSHLSVNSKDAKCMTREIDDEFSGAIIEAIYIFLDSPVGAQYLESILRGPNLHLIFQDKLERALWRMDKRRARSWLLDELKKNDSYKGVWILKFFSGNPRPDDEQLLRLAFQHKLPAIRYLGLNGLAWLDVDHVQLAQKCLQLDDIFLRLRSHGVLAQYHVQESILFLRKLSNDLSAPLVERAEALRWLAHSDPVRHFDILSENLIRDDAHCDGYHQPVKEECAYGLARVGTDDALTYLLRAKFTKMSNPASGAISDYIMKILNWNSHESSQESRDFGFFVRYPEPLKGKAFVRLFPNVWRGTWPWYPGWLRV